MTDETASPADSRREDDYALDADLVAGVVSALAEGDAEEVRRRVDPLHEADLADLIEQLDSPDRRALVAALGPDALADVLTELSEGARDDVLDMLAPETIAAAARELDTDDIVYLVEDLEPEDRREVLDRLDAEDRAVVEQSLGYPEYSAGRLMQRETVTAPPFWTVGQMIDWLRSRDDLPEPFYEVIVVDPAMKPVGTIPLSRILGARRPATLEGIMETEFRTLRADEPQEDVAYAFNKYHLVSAPVVDAHGRLAGVITIDDAMAALSDEAEEDLLRLGGVGDEEISDSTWETWRLRMPWLAVNTVTAFLAASVIGLFDHVIEQLVALAVLMPITASMGGNAGTQSLTVAVRGLATRSLTDLNAWRVVRREALVGLVNGALFGAVIGAAGAAWFGEPRLGLVLGLAMVANLLVAALAGVLVPLALDRAGADPAVSSGVFVTTMTDIVGFFAFLGLGALILL
jgi:magnesium transporter